MSEFTGKSREVFRVRVILEKQRQVEHESEGWINMPSDKPSVIEAIKIIETENEQLAKLQFQARK